MNLQKWLDSLEHKPTIKEAYEAGVSAERTRWLLEIGQVMPKDFKDFWENSPEEWPLVTRLVIENLRKRSEE